MFGLWKRKKPIVHKHWYVLLPDFAVSTEEFYAAIEQELEAQQVSGLALTREEFAEGGMLSTKRIYLRMRRERLVFDVCSAPFGTAWFFSCRFAEIPFVLRVWEVLVILIASGVIWGFYVMLFGTMFGTILLGASILGFALLCRNLIAMGLHDLDAGLLQVPIVGAVYESLFRKDSYYRQDTRIMYVDTVDRVVRTKVQETTLAHGLEDIQFKDVDPIDVELTLLQLLWMHLTASRS